MADTLLKDPKPTLQTGAPPNQVDAEACGQRRPLLELDPNFSQNDDRGHDLYARGDTSTDNLKNASLTSEKMKRLSTSFQSGGRYEGRENVPSASRHSTASALSKGSLNDLFEDVMKDYDTSMSDASLLVSPNTNPSESTASFSGTERSWALREDSEVTELSSLAGDSRSMLADTDSSFRLTPRHYVSMLTPTKIAPSPRRVVNPLSPSSPARNTRSSSRILRGVPRQLQGFVDEDEHDTVAKKRRIGEDQGADSSSTLSEPVVWPKARDSVGLLLSGTTNNAATARKTRKSVAFGSPEAAEYHIGSPSMSLTPMPARQVKALFSIPKGASPPIERNMHTKKQAASLEPDSTVEIESTLNELVGNLANKIDAGPESEQANDPLHLNASFLRREQQEGGRVEIVGVHDTDSFELTGNSGQTNLSSLGSGAEAGSLPSTQAAKLLHSFKMNHQEDSTVELEADLSALLNVEQPSVKTQLPPLQLNRVFTSCDISDDSALLESIGEAHDESKHSIENDQTISLELTLGAVLNDLTQTPTSSGSNLSAGRMTGLATSEKQVGQLQTPGSIVGGHSPHQIAVTPLSRTSLSLDDSGSVRMKHSPMPEVGQEETAARHSVSALKKRVASMELSWDLDLLTIGEDVLLKALGCPVAGNPILVGAVQDCWHVVCDEIETKAELTTPRSIDDVLESSYVAQSGLMGSGESSVRDLLAAVKEIVEFEWMNWECMVSQSILGTVGSLPQEFSGEFKRIQSSLELYDGTLEALTGFAGCAARRSRLARCQEGIRATEEIVQRLGARHAESLSKLGSATELASANEEEYRGRSENARACDKIEIYRSSADRCRFLYTVTKSLSGLRIDEVAQGAINIGFLYSASSDRLELILGASRTDLVECSVERHIPTGRNAEGSVGGSACHLDAKSVGKHKHAGLSLCDARALVANMASMRGRSLLLGREIAGLEKKYGAVFVRNGARLEVKFTNQKSTFLFVLQVTDLYPFGPLHVECTNESDSFDLHKLRRQLNKNARTGFGQMSRTCDLIAAFIRSTS